MFTLDKQCFKNTGKEILITRYINKEDYWGPRPKLCEPDNITHSWTIRSDNFHTQESATSNRKMDVDTFLSAVSNSYVCYLKGKNWQVYFRTPDAVRFSSCWYCHRSHHSGDVKAFTGHLFLDRKLP